MEGSISFDNVSFYYPSRPHDHVLRNINFTVNHGERIAIVGESGAGKSTLVSLLIGLFQPSEGMIKYDSIHLDSINLDHLRKQFGYVSQEPVLFDCTIRENILMGNADAGESQIHQALVEANADKFVHQLPQKLDTSAGENGAKLSGGQKQRIAIARASVRQPKVLIFDEATSALDSKNEKILLKTVEKVCKNKTSIIITHRLNLALKADRIIVLKYGEIVEEGKPHQLLEQRHILFQMFESQFDDNLNNTLERKALSYLKSKSHFKKDKNSLFIPKDYTPLFAKETVTHSKSLLLRDLFGLRGKTILNLLLGFCFSLIDALTFRVIGILMANALHSFTLDCFLMKEQISTISLQLFLIAIVSALGTVITILADQIVNIFSCTISALICWIVAFYIATWFALCCFVVFPLKQILQFGKAYIKLWNLRRSKPLQDKISKFVIDLLNNIQSIKVFSLEEAFFKKYQEMMNLLRKRRLLEAYCDATAEVLQSAMDFVFYVFGFGIGGVFVSHGLITTHQMWLQWQKHNSCTIGKTAYDPDQGTIKIYGIDIKDVDVDYLRKNVVKVSQEPVLFDCSIEENIKLGLEYLTHEEVECAAKMANAHHFITALNQGYEAKVGEKGVQLSGGQKQRIAIARGLIREPVLLILDEPSSALDYHSEKAIQQTLKQQTFTRLIITHRLATTQCADEIIVMFNGKIVENGTYDDLMNEKGHYWIGEW